MGTEDSLFDCSGAVVGSHNCDHSLDAGAVCVIECEQSIVSVVTIIRSFYRWTWTSMLT